MRFNPPPNWPPAPVGWTPPAGWRADPSWPAPPPGWRLWIDEDPLDDNKYDNRVRPTAPRKRRRRQLFGVLILVVIVVVTGVGVYKHFQKKPYQTADFPTIALPGLPTGIAVDPAAKRIYVAWRDQKSTAYNGGLAVLETDSQKVLSNVSLKTIPGTSLPVEPGDLAVDPAEHAAFVVMFPHDSGGDTRVAQLTKIDTDSASVVGSIPIGLGGAITIDPGAHMVYVVNRDAAQKYGLRPEDTSSVSAVDTRTFAVKATVPVATVPRAVAVNPNTHVAYVASGPLHQDQSNWPPGTVSAIDPTSLSVTKTFTVGANPTGLAIDPAGRTLYVANNMDNSVGAIDLDSGQMGQLIGGVSVPEELVLDADNHALYVCQVFASSVSMINTSTRQIVWTKHNGNPACGAVDSTSHKVYIGQYSSGALTVVDPPT
jgi:YVTN family beta-propeller protein